MTLLFDSPAGLTRANEARRPWWWEITGWSPDSDRFVWLERNRRHRHTTGLEIEYRPRGDRAICGERVVDPTGTEVVCTVVGAHGEMPHVGCPAPCADDTCSCGTYHLAIVGVAYKPVRGQA